MPEEGDYYDRLSVKPGFDFFQALIAVRDKLDRFMILIPETLFFNHQAFLITNDERGRVQIVENPKNESFIKIVEAKAGFDISQNELEPSTVLRKASEHPCYMTVNLLNWRQTYEQLREGPPNRSMLQRYQPSFGDRMTIYRAVVHNIEILTRKGPNSKHNFCYALTNRLPFKTPADDNADLVQIEAIAERKKKEENDKKRGKIIPPPVVTDEDRRKEAAMFRSRFESRYLTCPFNVGSFDVFTYTGKSMV